MQANILDAVANRDYFTRIIQRYAHPDDKILLFSDINATILLEDTIQHKEAPGVLLSTMFALADVSPRETGKLVFEWDSREVSVSKMVTVKQLVQEVSKKEVDYYYIYASCLHL